MKITIPVASFDCPAFVKQTWLGRKGDSEVIFPVQNEFLVIDDQGFVDEDTTLHGKRNVAREIATGKVLIFAPFVGPNVDFVTAVDGTSYGGWDEETEEEISIPLASDVEIGFVISLKKSKLIFETAEFFYGMCTPPSPPRVSRRENVGVFAKAMKKYLKRFCRRGG